jgi:hypothetical protein
MDNVTYAEGQHRPPRNLRTILKSPTMLSPIQCDEFNEMVEDNGGYPRGVPPARDAFKEKYEDNGRAWVLKEDE